MQVDGLIGEKGILPIAEFLPAARAHLGSNAPFVLPTLCWFNASDAFLHFLCGAGAVLSVLLIAGFVPVISLVLLFVFYLSLTIAGQTFLSFQWDILLLETGFLAIFFAPFRWRINADASTSLLTGRSFPSEAAALQIDADVGRGETDQRRRFLVEPDRARLSLLDATAPDRFWLVGASRTGMAGQAFHFLCPVCRMRRPVFYLGAKAAAAHCLGAVRLAPAFDRAHGQLLLLQSPHDRALPALDRRPPLAVQGAAISKSPKRAFGKRAIQKSLFLVSALARCRGARWSHCPSTRC